MAAARCKSAFWTGLVLLSLTGVVLSQEPAASGAGEIGNWEAPAYWTPPEGSAARVGGLRPEAVESTPTGALPFTGIAPCRMFDSRVTGGAIASGTTRTIPLTGAPCGIPANAAAVSVNVAIFAIVGTSSNGVLVVYPAGSPSTSQALLNWSPTVGQIDNASVVILGTGGAITVQPNQGSGSISLVVDVNGYYGGGVVTSVNGLINDVTLAAGSNVTITPSGQTLTIAATGGGSGGITQIDAGTGLTGGGSSGVVTLGIANGGVGTTQIAANAITAPKVASGQVVKNVNGLFDGVTLAAGSGIAITPSGQTLTIASTAPAAWGLGGNAGLGCTTSPCLSFIGTTDAGDALEFRVTNRRAYRYSPGTDTTDGFSPNLIGGYEGNTVTGAGTAGATIGGGGAAANLNTVSASFGTVAGGLKGTVSGFAATVGGGQLNSATGSSATVSGGALNQATGDTSAVLGGFANVAAGTYSSVLGGWDNGASGVGSFAAGRHAQANADGVFVWSDGTSAFQSTTVPNQFLVQATGGVGINTNAPAAALDVAGTIRSRAGGFKFPDATTQTTAGISSVGHDGTLSGNGTGASLLGIASGGVGTAQLSAAGSSNGQVLASNGSSVVWQTAAAGTITGVSAGFGLTGGGSSGSVTLALQVPSSLIAGYSSPILSATNVSSGAGLMGTAGSGYGVHGVSNNQGVFGESPAAGGVGVSGYASATSGFTRGVYGESDSSAGYAIHGYSPAGTAIYANGHTYGLQSYATGVAVYGESSGGDGVYAYGPAGRGVYAIGTQYAVEALSTTGYGVYGQGGTWAGYFAGNVKVSGSCCSAAFGSYQVDHPLDPENKYLNLDAVSSPDLMNISSGNVVLGENGEATVELPDWFEALHRDFRYQLTAIGSPAPMLHIAEKVTANRFKIAGGTAGQEVSWQVTGIRKDPYANAHRVPVEEEKPVSERGTYLHPEAYGQPEERGVDWIRHPDAMRRMKQESQAAADRAR